MNKQDKDTIKKYESNILSAGKSNYVRMMPKYALERLLEIYNRELGTSLSANFGCGVCALDFLKKFYKNIYLNMK